MVSLTDFKALSFDCFGTLIDSGTGSYKALQTLVTKLPPNHQYVTQPTTLVKRLESLQLKTMSERPRTLHRDILAACYEQLAAEAGVSVTEQEKADFSRSVGNWPAHKDTVAGLKVLKKYYKLIILSNVDNEGIEATLTGPLAEVKFDAVYTAQDIGSYKPDLKNFAYLYDHAKSELGLEKSEILHTARSLPADHIPAKQLGVTSVWIARGDDDAGVVGAELADLKDDVDFTWRFPSIGAMAEAVDHDFSRKH